MLRKKNFNKLKIKHKKDKKKYIVIVTSILLMISLTIGSSYAYLSMTSKTNNSVVINAGTLALTFQNETNTINIENAVPISDEEGLNQDEEYSFDVKNNGDIPATYKITLNNTCTTGNGIDLCIPDDYIKVGLKIGDNNYKVLAKKDSSYILDTGNLSKNEFHKYKMKIWLDYDTPNTYNSAGEKTVVYSGKLSLSYEQVKGIQVTLDANGGIIPTGNDWTGSGEFATKIVFYEGTYGTLPEPTRSGYTFKGWNGINLLDVDKLYNGYIVSDGSSCEVQWYRYSDYIEIDGNTLTYVDCATTSSSLRYVAFYDENKVFIDGSRQNSDEEGSVQTLAIPGDAKYVRLNVTPVKVDKAMLYLGSAFIGYEPYYILPSTKVVQQENHTLKALWEAN